MVDALVLALRAPGMRERGRVLGLAVRAFLTVASRQPGLLGRLFRAPKLREYELRPAPDAPVLRLRSNDMVVMEVYGGRPYELDYEPLGEVDSILDVGANVGTASAFLATRFSGARIVAVEPNPFTFELLRENLRRAAPEGIAVNAAVVARPGSYQLEPGTSPSNDQVVATPARGEGDLEALTVDELLDRYLPGGVDLMKVDIEGGEHELFEGVAEWAPRVRAIVAEVHAPLTTERACELLRAGGFEPLPVAPGRARRELVFCLRAGRSQPVSA